jgi:hypothetical protein
MVGLCQFCHGFDIVHDHIDIRRAGIPGYVVCPGQYDDCFGNQMYHVLSESQKHLRAGLSADSSSDVVIFGKELRIQRSPILCN